MCRSALSIPLVAFVAALIGSSLAKRCDLNPSAHVFSFGAVKGFVIYDGPHTSEGNAFYRADEEVKKQYDKHFRPSFPFVYSRNPVVLELPDRRIIVDTGAFNALARVPLLQATNDPATFLENLKAAGIPPNSVDAVLLTHGHHDHILGLINENGKPTFRKAHVYIGEQEHNFWMSLLAAKPPSPAADNTDKSQCSAEGVCEEDSVGQKERAPPAVPPELIAQAVKAYKDSIGPYEEEGRFHVVGKDESPLTNVTFIPAYGDTPGHNVVEVDSEGDRLLIISDTWISTPDQLENPSWNYKLSFIPQLALAARMSILSRAARGRDLVLAYHEPFPGLGHVRTNGESFTWVPMFTQHLGVGVKTRC